ncbi:MAG TPA: SGNH/GDSL hydrolase family protein [Solirubrobacteraceae bacterium]|nr:SGNH/GDSL hydrolase family protein [Solirubrobacteraceae bacterium]
MSDRSPSLETNSTVRRGRRWLPLTPARLAAAFAAALLACVAAPAAATAASTYVSLGDSYTAGPFILPPAAGAPLECLQSARDYSHLTAAALGLSLSDVSCSGATTENLTTSAQYPDQPPQEDALSTSTQVVSVGIGGNDNGLFLDTLLSCGAEDLVFPFGTPCKDTYDNKLAEEIAADGPVIGAALHQIHVDSPAAKVFVVGYPDILPQSGNCWPTVPLTTGDVAYLNGVEQDLNAMLSSEAAANEASFVNTYTPSIGHDACKSLSVRYVEPVLPESDAFSVHPNERGMEADAAELESAMRAQGIS